MGDLLALMSIDYSDSLTGRVRVYSQGDWFRAGMTWYREITSCFEEKKIYISRYWEMDNRHSNHLNYIELTVQLNVQSKLCNMLKLRDRLARSGSLQQTCLVRAFTSLTL